MKDKWIKSGWIFFTVSSFIWILPFCVFWFIKSKILFSISGTLLCLAGIGGIIFFAPWKFPDTRLWKLLIFPYAIFLLSVFLLVYDLTGFKNLKEILYGLWLIPCFTPFLTLGWRKWSFFTNQQNKN